MLALDAESEYAAATERRQQARDHLVQVLRARGQKTEHVNFGNAIYRATVVAGERTRIDEAGLAKAIGKRAYNKLTVSRVDPRKVEWAIKNGHLDLEKAAPFISIVPSSAFPKITEVEDDE
jgi:hypothetical protein